MSFRELRNFVEIMRTLGYPRIVSMENFRSPNFELVADILYWMVKLYDPDCTISDRVEFESERIEFLTSIEALMASKARLKINTKKLYAADGYAVQEMLKIATLLHSAVRLASSTIVTEEIAPLPIKLHDVKTVRVLASEITQSGAKLHDLLATESTDRGARVQALRFLEAVSSSTADSREQAFMERSLRDMLETARQRVEDVKKVCEELQADERNVQVKIQRKQEELERTEKRLRSFDPSSNSNGGNGRPQFMEEAERLQAELTRNYEVYMDRHRNLDYLQRELATYRAQEEENKRLEDARVVKIREELKKREIELLREGGLRDRDDGNDDDFKKNNNSNGLSSSRSNLHSREQQQRVGSRGDDNFRPSSRGSFNRNSKPNGYPQQPMNKQQQQQQMRVSGSLRGPVSEGEESGSEVDSNNDDDDDDDDEDDDDEELSVGPHTHTNKNNSNSNSRNNTQNINANSNSKFSPQKTGSSFGASKRPTRHNEDDDEDDDDNSIADDGGNVSVGSDDDF